ncbi:hypothetical protein JCGZ_06900 [Jatropha curcas]|uniref:Uncharacterized protein n=1 Tax=Jatropha curcas TaxID=180498 RepID=A0A067KNG3_JATCU|nr:hypothetical protein JCGZ_06900 [Jatropha curcas]
MYPALQAWECPVNEGTNGLGYEPTDEDQAEREPFRCPAAKKLPGLEIFSDVWGNKPDTITELEAEDFMQPSLFDEVAVITGSDENRDLLNLIKPSGGPLTNWYAEEDRTTDRPPPE